MNSLRRFISILLLGVFGLPCFLPVLAMGQETDSGLPACCRRDGQHHCTMSMAERTRLVSSGDPQFRTPVEECPYRPSSVSPAHPQPLTEPSPATSIYGDLFSHPTGFAQTEARRRISRDRAHQKRGPPALSLG